MINDVQTMMISKCHLKGQKGVCGATYRLGRVIIPKINNSSQKCLKIDFCRCLHFGANDDVYILEDK